MRGVPQRLEHQVGETQRQDVLHRLLAEIVIDTEDLMLFEMFADDAVQCAGGFEVAPDRLFHHQARAVVDKAEASDPHGEIAEQRRPHR